MTTRSRPNSARTPTTAACTLAVKVVPGASRDDIVGWLGDELKVRVQAPPLDGRANVAVCALVAGRLGCADRHVNIARGDTSRRKHLRIDGLSIADVRARLGA